jgi:hypothetical protein
MGLASVLCFSRCGQESDWRDRRCRDAESEAVTCIGSSTNPSCWTPGRQIAAPRPQAPTEVHARRVGNGRIELALAGPRCRWPEPGAQAQANS